MKFLHKASCLFAVLTLLQFLPPRIVVILNTMLLLSLLGVLTLLLFIAVRDLHLFGLPSLDRTGTKAFSGESPLYRYVSYKGIDVYYTKDLNGGGLGLSFEFARLVEQEYGKVEHVLEYCAGPGFIGFHLLASGLCERLTLAERNPQAVEAIKTTIRMNGLADRVTVYQSDCLDGIPAYERWDLAVGNPPWKLDTEQERNVILCDPGSRVHRNFFATIHKFLKPDGVILFVESHEYTEVAHIETTLKDTRMRVTNYFPHPTLQSICRSLLEHKTTARALDLFLQLGLYVNEIYFLEVRQGPVQKSLTVPADHAPSSPSLVEASHL